jgi:hypothetical protein
VEKEFMLVALMLVIFILKIKRPMKQDENISMRQLNIVIVFSDKLTYVSFNTLKIIKRKEILFII